MSMLSISWDTARLFLHVLASPIWADGQITPAARSRSCAGPTPDIPRAAAQRFNQLAWPAFGVPVIMGSGMSSRSGHRSPEATRPRWW